MTRCRGACPGKGGIRVAGWVRALPHKATLAGALQCYALPRKAPIRNQDALAPRLLLQSDCVIPRSLANPPRLLKVKGLRALRSLTPRKSDTWHAGAAGQRLARPGTRHRPPVEGWIPIAGGDFSAVTGPENPQPGTTVALSLGIAEAPKPRSPDSVHRRL